MDSPIDLIGPIGALPPEFSLADGTESLPKVYDGKPWGNDLTGFNLRDSNAELDS
jgi:hypothetical protein